LRCNSLPAGGFGSGFRGFAFAALFCAGFSFFDFAALDFFFGIHAAAAGWGFAIAGAGVVGAVVEAVVVGDFAAGGDVAEGDDEDSAIFFNGFGVAFAAVVDEHGGAEAVDDDPSVTESKEVGDGVVLVEVVGFFFGDAAAGVFGDAFAFGNDGGGITAGGVDG